LASGSVWLSSPSETSETTNSSLSAKATRWRSWSGAVSAVLNHAAWRLDSVMAFQLVKLPLPPKAVRSARIAARC